MTTSIFKFELGQKVRDTVHGFEGTITSRIEYLNGCIRYDVGSRNEKPTDEPKGYTFDEDQLEAVDEAPAREVAERTGGLRPAPSRVGL